ncbi:MAG: hypothetical protein A3H32_08510 [Betaproteobacteria bacterium RIFCSPLOWO2_02_FULL_63_19]|nr:MAG: hypothetical protein A3H32_08510 [Betaproteobacteria bacterium RIFCSPLOWO2_02_FULL_63_19]
MTTAANNDGTVIMSSHAGAANADFRVGLAVASGAAPLAMMLGHATRAVRGKVHEDFYGVAVPGNTATEKKGVVVVLADGIGAHGKGRMAAEVTVRSLLSDYYATSPSWSIAQALEKLMCATNDWIVAHNRNQPDNDGSVAAASALVLHGRQYFIAHVGNTRVYRVRDSVFEKLTNDHTWPRRDMRNVLKRAIGLDTYLVVDFVEGDIREGDSFIIASDGVWDTLGERRFRAVYAQSDGSQAAADALVNSADEVQETYLGRNDASAVVLSIESAG